MKAPVSLTNAPLAMTATLALLLAPVVGLADDIDETLEIAADGVVQVNNLAGTIEITTWERNEVHVTGETGDRVEEVEFNTTSKGVQIKVKNRKDSKRIDGTDLYLRVPEGASIEADSVSADITVDGSRGESLMLNTVSGDLEAEAEVSRLELASVSGDIEFEGSASRSSAESVSGDVTLVGPSDEVSASTVSGDLSLEAGALNRARFETVSGTMTLEVSIADGGRLTSDAMSGDVKLRLPSSQQAEFSVQSYSGSIQSDFGETRRVSRGPGEMLEHSEGDNGAEIRIETFSGDVYLRKQ